jgi:hypothetical protein
MDTIHGRGILVLAAGLLAGCTDRIIPTAAYESQTATVDAAATSTSIVTDPIGDVKNKAPTWLDLTSGSITRRDDRFRFELDMAAPVPANPTLDPAVPAHSDHVCIGTGLETDPTSAPVGYPFGKNEANFAEFYVAVCWNPTGSFGLGTGFVGLLIDRRPLLTGQPALVVPAELTIAGNQVTVSVEAAALGDPSTLAWVTFTEIANQGDPNDAAWFPDSAPDATFATWPQ